MNERFIAFLIGEQHELELRTKTKFNMPRIFRRVHANRPQNFK